MPKSKILVVDDTLDTRELIHLHLTSEDFDVILAANGQEGLYLANAERPDLIITDVEMPKLNGIEMIKELRVRPGSQSIPILVLTAATQEVMDDAIRTGATRAISKPLLFDELVADVKELLADSGKEPPTGE
ncbi:MAG: hypothetical protein DMF61_12245 [Blastocatellia bacterium AA13]|nr:MAG: hypothetical protein DMF61_12245 [Blastocatellia bacterium AA13]